jgi:hypothetical protein
MRRTLPVMLAAATATAALAGCGGGKQFANNPRPPAPVDLTVYINDHYVTVSPSKVGAGPIIFIVTNQASQSESLQVQSAGASAGAPLANTGPISPQATATVKVDLQPGDYTVGTASSGANYNGGIAPAQLHLGKSRPNADNLLLQP